MRHCNVNRLLTVLTLALLTVFCSTNYSDSDFEILTYHDILTQIQSIADTSYNKYSKDSTVRYETYRLDSNTIAYISYMRDTLVAIGRKTNGVNTALGEYYPNGQLVGKINFKINGQIDGPATYYYKDGRIRTTGHFTDGTRTGEWKDYNPIGQLVTIKTYNDKGELEKSEEIKNIQH